MDSIIEDCTNNHISLLKIILIIMGKDIDLNESYNITKLNDNFKTDLKVNKPHTKISNEDDEEEEVE